MADSKKPRGDDSSDRVSPSTPDGQDDELTDVDAENLSADAEQVPQIEDAADRPTRPKPVKRNQTVAPVKKAKPTRKQSEATRTEHKRTTPVQFTKQAIGELKKVVWPTASTTRQYFIVVLIFVLFIMAFIAGLDAFFGWLLLLWLS